jgi:hypothetical protein
MILLQVDHGIENFLTRGSATGHPHAPENWYLYWTIFIKLQA